MSSKGGGFGLGVVFKFVTPEVSQNRPSSFGVIWLKVFLCAIKNKPNKTIWNIIFTYIFTDSWLYSIAYLYYIYMYISDRIGILLVFKGKDKFQTAQGPSLFLHSIFIIHAISKLCNNLTHAISIVSFGWQT
jgi:hypothetical protein